MDSRKPRIVILGAGPTGLEAALYARQLDYPVKVIESSAQVAANVRRWGFVRLFTPWHRNASELGLAALKALGLSPPVAADVPTGEQLCTDYLEPISHRLGGSIHLRTQVLGVARSGVLKGEFIGSDHRANSPFRILFRNQLGEGEEGAEVVFDTTGVYGSPVQLGDGGLPALGESSLRGRIRYHLVDVLGRERENFTAKRTLVIGSGFSAATSLVDLSTLAETEPGTEVFWALRSTGPAPFPTYADDPLPQRVELAERGNRILAQPPAYCRTIPGVSVRAIAAHGDLLQVGFRSIDGGDPPPDIEVDHIISNCGYRPNTDLFRELQIHQCYATEGPMQLSASLLQSQGDTGDCLDQTSAGIDTLMNPEPGYFVLGHKSYGRRSDYLMQVGREQIRDVFRYLENDPELDLYASTE